MQAYGDQADVARSYNRLLLQALCYSSVVGAVSLLIPLYALSLKASLPQLGCIVGSRGVGHFLLVIPVGFLTDRFGIRKVFIVASLCSAAILLAIPQAGSPELLMVLATLEGFSCSSRLTALNAWYFRQARLIPKARAGWYRGASNLGLTIIGAASGALLADRFGFAAAFATLALFVLVTNVILVARIREEGTASLTRLDAYWPKLFRLVKDPGVSFVYLAETLCLGLLTSFRTLMVVLLAGTMHHSSGTVSTAVLVLGSAVILVVFVCGPLLGRFQEGELYFAGAGIVAASLALLGFSRTLPTVYATALLLGIGLGLVTLVNFRQMAVLPGERGMLAGIFTFAAGVGLAAAPAASTFIVERFGFAFACWAFIPLFLLLGLCGWRRSSAGSLTNPALYEG